MTAAHQLDAGKIVATIEALQRRIVERFPQSGLGKVCGELLAVARVGAERAEQIARPIPWVRLVSALLIATIVVSAGWTARILLLNRTEEKVLHSAELIQVLEAAGNGLVLIGATVFFFVTLETRIKRRRALKALHELRVIAHIIDMHQLTKDPERVLHQGSDTRSSPHRTMTQFELGRYLDYCSEMLSLTGKLAALYVQNFEDDVAVSAVNDIETLTNGMARKIWQKLSLLVASAPHLAARPATPPAPAAEPAE
jgi:hypothetical protein